MENKEQKRIEDDASKPMNIEIPASVREFRINGKAFTMHTDDIALYNAVQKQTAIAKYYAEGKGIDDKNMDQVSSALMQMVDGAIGVIDMAFGSGSYRKLFGDSKPLSGTITIFQAIASAIAVKHIDTATKR